MESFQTKSALRANVTGSPTMDQVNILRFTPLDKSNYESVDYSMPVGEVKTFSLSASNTEVTNGGLVISDYSKIPENTVLKLRAVALARICVLILGVKMSQAPIERTLR